MNWIARLSADHRLLGWCIVIALSIAPALGFLGFRMAETVESGWVDPSVLQTLEDAQDTFSFNAPLVLVLEADDFFTIERMSALQQTTAELREMSNGRNLVWMGDIPEVTLRGAQTPLLPPTDELTVENLQTAKERLLEHPLSKGSLVAPDGQTVLLLIDSREQSDVRPVTDAAKALLTPIGIRVRPTGALALYEVHDRTLEGDHIRIQLMAYALVTLLAVLIFRRPAAIVIAAAGPFVGVAWTLGWLQLIGQSENELAKIILPVMIIMIGFTDGVHLVVRIRRMRSCGSTQRDAVYDSVLHIGPACLLTSLTTAIGFGSLIISNSETIAGFGRVSAIGVVLTFCSVVLLTPLLANSWIGKRIHVNSEKDTIFNMMTGCVGIVNFASRHALTLTIAGFFITGACLYACTHLVPDDRISDRVPHTSDEWQAMRHCDTHVGGIRYMRLVLSWSEDNSRTEVWKALKACEELLASEPLVGDSMSIRTTLTIFKGPDRRDNSVLVNKLPEEIKRQFYRDDIRKAQVVARVQDNGIATMDPVFIRITDAVKNLEDEHDGITIDLVSGQLLEGRVVRQMIEELMKSLFMASLVIFAVLAIAFRSLRVGLISIMPNIMPLAASGALRLVIDESLGIASACSFAICLGIAVDDTIHYLMHFRHERHEGRTPYEANRNTFITVGSALMMTTIVMMAGLGTVLTSSMPPHVNFAAMACTTLGAALLADLLFLPALLTLFPGKLDVTQKKPEAAKEDDSESEESLEA